MFFLLFTFRLWFVLDRHKIPVKNMTLVAVTALNVEKFMGVENIFQVLKVWYKTGTQVKNTYVLE